MGKSDDLFVGALLPRTGLCLPIVPRGNAPPLATPRLATATLPIADVTGAVRRCYMPVSCLASPLSLLREGGSWLPLVSASVFGVGGRHGSRASRPR